MMGGMGMGFGLAGMFFMLVFWGLLIFGAVWMARSLFGNTAPPPGSSNPESPRQILDQRYARGEITREQYEIMKEDIG